MAFVDPDEVKQPAPSGSGFRDPDAAAPHTRGQESPTSPRNLVGAALEPIATMASGAVAAPVSGLAGLATAGANALGLTDQQPGDVVRKFGNAMTYQPKTVGGQNAMSVIGYPFEKLAEGADYAGGKVADVTGSPAAGAAVNTALQVVPQALTQRYGPPVTKNLTAEGGPNAPLMSTIAGARELGLTLPPSQLPGAGFVTKKLEGFGGKIMTGQETSQKNQPIIDSAARRMAGLKPDEPITVASLEKRRNEVAQPYRDIAAIDAEAAQAVKDLRQARFDTTANYRHYDISADPRALSAARAAEAKATALDAYIDDIAKNAGKPQLVPQLREARQAIAKTYDVERSLNIGNGSIDARILGRAADKGRPLSGEALKMARVAEAFPQAVRPPASMGSVLPDSPLNFGTAALLHGMDGASVKTLIPFLRSPVRSMVLSDIYQNMLTTSAPQIGHIGLQAAPLGILQYANTEAGSRR